MKTLASFVDTVNTFIPTRSNPWWGWPLALFGLAVLCTGAAFLVYPNGTHEELWLLGLRFGGECGMKVQFGIPCPQCGMTRSWVGIVRGDLLNAFIYNPAGFLLYFWILIGGVIGFLRLILRKPYLLSPPWALLFAWCIFWMIVPYTGLYFARLAGINPLPEYHASFNTAPQSSPQD
jgi:hypothetical protein